MACPHHMQKCPSTQVTPQHTPRTAPQTTKSPGHDIRCMPHLQPVNISAVTQQTTGDDTVTGSFTGHDIITVTLVMVPVPIVILMIAVKIILPIPIPIIRLPWVPWIRIAKPRYSPHATQHDCAKALRWLARTTCRNALPHR